MKKKPNIVLYTFLMIIVFLAITELFIWGYGSTFLLNTITNYPQGNLVITEAILASLVLIVMLLFKNQYVFTQKHEKFIKGLFYGLFYLIGVVIFLLLYGVIAGGFKAGYAVVNLIVGCFLVGVTEEFLCRGWLLNEFLERFGDTKKGVWYSIIISGLIFGLLHLGNIFLAGQSVSTTVIQVMSATGTGIVFGLIYYKTKNIWSVIFLHGLWDFSLFLGQIAPVESVIETVPSFSYISIFFSILMVAAELLNIIPYLKDIDAKPKTGTIIFSATVGFTLFLLFTVISGLGNMNFKDEYKFDSIKIDNYSITRDNYEDYFIKYSSLENYNFKLTENEDNNLVLTNLNTNYSIEFICQELYDYIIMEEKDYYILAYLDYTDSANPFLNYIYIMKNELSNSQEFMDSIKTKMKKYLLSDISELLVLNDREKDISYIGAYSQDYGYYLLTSEDKMSILNRD